MSLQGLSEITLLKKWWRSDALWTSNFLYHSPLKRIPFSMDTRALLESQYWKREKTQALQDKKLDMLIRRAAKLPFWRGRIEKSGIVLSVPMTRIALSKLPVTSKKDFRLDTIPDYFDTSLAGKSRLDKSSGSTGKPFGFSHDRSFELRSFANCERIFLTAGSGRRFPVISMRARDRMGFAFTNYRFFHVQGYHSIRHRLPHLQELISSIGGDVILFGVSSSLAELARLVRKEGIHLPLRAILAAGEELPNPLRDEIEEALRAKVYMYYSLSEVGRLAFECDQRRLHINEEWAYVEVTDDEGVPLPSGQEGHVVVTGFENHVMPFIRYDTGDRGIIEKETCPCGRTLRTMQLRGRQIELITFEDGHTVSPIDAAGILHKNLHAVEQFQIVRAGEYAFRIRVVAGKQFDEARPGMIERLQKLLHPRAEIVFDTDTPLVPGPNGKARTFIDETASLRA